MKLFHRPNDEDDDYLNDERQCLIKLFAVSVRCFRRLESLVYFSAQCSCKSNREYRALEICQWMDPIALQLAIKYATKSGKLTLAQKINEEFFDERKEKDDRCSDLQHRPAPTRRPPPSSFNTASSISVIELTDEPRPSREKASSNNASFINPFRKKVCSLSLFCPCLSAHPIRLRPMPRVTHRRTIS